MGFANCLANLSASSVSPSTSGASAAWSPRTDKRKAARMALKAWRVVQQFTFITVVPLAALISERAHNEGIACHLYIGLWSNAAWNLKGDRESARPPDDPSHFVEHDMRVF